MMNACKSNEIRTLNKANSENLKSHIENIIRTPQFRNHENTESLNLVAEFIQSQLRLYCDTTYEQAYTVNQKVYKNIIGIIGAEHKKTIIIGAHYDVAGNQQGADDNASGVLGLLELSRLIQQEKLPFKVEFVAYTLEEPPFFRSEKMGSYIHAKSLYDNKADVVGMICLEMIGYYNDAPNSQKYPLKILRWFFGSKGDFITIVRKWSGGRFANKISKILKKNQLIKTILFSGPAEKLGLDLSDHRNYWRFNYSAVMIGNTAFFRNPHYHEATDTIDKLDFIRMTLLIQQIYVSIVDYCKNSK